MPYLRLEVSSDVEVHETVLPAAARVIIDALEVKAGSLRLRVETLPEGTYYITDVNAGTNGKAQGPFVIAHVAILEGRDDAKKARLIADMTRVLAAELHVDERDVRVFIAEYPKVAWGIGGKTAAAAGR
ncbi:MAG TPA: tautomerase family protein [Candidatus Binatia bacterium]|nr:tautomerase family protein [Candidatus Binatia bacterium]